jgi:glycosyltransferase involved in cell wall biosynthesis
MGHYGGVYPITMTRDEARAALGLAPNQFVYLALGNIAAYKGLEDFTAAFSRCAGEHDVALIAGNVLDAALVGRLRAAATREPRIHLRAEFVPDERMQLFLLAADVLIAPFSHVLTSSSVMLGLSYGLPVVAPDRGCLPELVPGEAGVIYPANETNGLEEALQRIKTRDLTAMSRAARAVAAAYDWDDIGRRTAEVYQACLTP